MPPNKRKNQMREFVLGKLEESQRYCIQEQNLDHILVEERPDKIENPSTIDVLLLNRKRTTADIKEYHARNRQKGIFTAPIFFKDYETFFVRLAQRGRKKHNRTLRKYAKQEIDAMLHVRDLEQWALEQFKPYPLLCYYQPSTKRLEEGLRLFEMKNVELNYFHIGPDDPAYKHIFKDTRSTMKKISVDYRIAEECSSPHEGPIYLITGKKPSKMAVISFTPKFRNLTLPVQR